MKNKKIQILESSIEKLARILSERHGIRVVFKHGVCATEGKTIYLPVIPDDADEELLAAIQGHLDHEVAHVLYTNFQDIEKIADQRKLKEVVNVLEDPRIELKYIDPWPGSVVNFRNKREWALKKITEVVKEEFKPDENTQITVEKTSNIWEEMPKFDKILYASLIWAYVDFDRSHWFFKTYVEDEIFTIVCSVDDLIRKAKVAEKTSEVVEIAKEFLNRVGEEEDEVKEPPLPKGPSVAVASLIENSVKYEHGNSDHEYKIYTTENDIVERITKGDRAKYKRFITEASHTVSVLKRRLARSFLSTRSGSWETGKTRGKINQKAVFRVPFGTSKHVFKQHVDAEELNTCILMMVDHSGSMFDGGYGFRSFQERIPPIQTATQSAMILGEMANQLNIPFAVMGFSTDDPSVSVKRHEDVGENIQQSYVRWGNHWIGIYKDFDDLWKSNCYKLTSMIENYKHNTYDGESLRFAAQQLFRRPEKRKILLWLNDGMPQPCGFDDVNAHYQYACSCAREVEKLVELIAIGIQTEAVKSIYSNCIIVHNYRDLVQVCLTKFAELLINGKPKKRA